MMMGVGRLGLPAKPSTGVTGPVLWTAYSMYDLLANGGVQPNGTRDGNSYRQLTTATGLSGNFVLTFTFGSPGDTQFGLDTVLGVTFAPVNGGDSWNGLYAIVGDNSTPAKAHPHGNTIQLGSLWDVVTGPSTFSVTRDGSGITLAMTNGSATQFSQNYPVGHSAYSEGVLYPVCTFKTGASITSAILTT